MNDARHTVEAAVKEPHDAGALDQAAALGMDALPPLAELLTKDQPIEMAERCEAVLKSVLAGLFAAPLPGPDARRVASFQQQIGLLFKYKSYAVKAASPLGYAVFLQNPGQGFSFQEHITHKVEVFHILQPHPGGFVFLCSIEEWNAAYEPDAFNAWLRGAPDARYERFRHPARPGDVFVIDRLRTVHTVMGCALEEFATVSTDMVNRLHDQNQGAAMPDFFTRDWTQERLLEIEPPESRREVLFGNRGAGELMIHPQRIRGGQVSRMACGAIRISWYGVSAGERTGLFGAQSAALSLFVTAGRGRIFLCDLEEARAAQPPALDVKKGDLLMVPPFAAYGFESAPGEPLQVSEHRLPHEVAFVTERQ